MSNGKRRKERVGGAGQGSEVEEEAFGAALKSIQSGAFPDRAMGFCRRPDSLRTVRTAKTIQHIREDPVHIHFQCALYSILCSMLSPTHPSQYTRPTVQTYYYNHYISSLITLGQPIQDGNRVTEMENDILVVLQFLTWSIPCQPLSSRTRSSEPTEVALVFFF